MRILTVIGARPQFVKAAPVSAALRTAHEEYLVHTGQHYDYNMSDIFFEELGLPAPDLNLGAGSGTHATQTASMIAPLERAVIAQNPDMILVYGDTNSTVAAALVAHALDVPLAHVEAGLRSYNRTMPEEINRIVTDRVSDLLFCPSQVAVENLAKEGIREGVVLTGDVMVDAVLRAVETAKQTSMIHVTLGINAPYALLTIHRPANTDDPDALAAILSGCGGLDLPVIFPVHPRTRVAMDRAGIALPENVRLINPLGYIDMLCLLEAAEVALTDSGGLQKEAYILKTPAVTIRTETEWVETVASGWNRLVAPDAQAIVSAVAEAAHNQPETHPDYYGDGNAAERIVAALEAFVEEHHAERSGTPN
ncbi:MAG: UDP-N-acetylglucosamine 2-epimerase (non-hydrolyzing) [Chloroflexi bacterium]|nr:UDP-N-acetylglucosamine 2-epimerase (non-hydrolyzing) [Chloroflexota bacterium]MCC6566172.1 UDP-N-acetylglucosamine 2-epimerase (non-hydrolyzing) [Chloroflexota bacterium]MDL1915893.1 UDP-N-acetylglucosamine 2-epimerase (non-hydrolyzing) [Anaerolineae bacterium CFX4]OQY81561.1 MAG: UDP-N-acetylglucosamine 2-epimerase (non-hydrolyzing) [Anaerolineae bacterium UTCFX5]GIK30319.1 MAG: UDP-N-acetyl glucosamine 2-epimerase [Chloroflexota bacterium]